MTIALDSNKTKIAKRVIEVFEFFASENRRATVMDIVRRYDRPQSSTSELLGALVELGLLYKDPASRSYAPTPRLAAFGFAAQPEPIASGRLFDYMDRLAQTSRAGVGLFGVVGTHVQLFRWVQGADLASGALDCGASVPLSASPVGLLLLSSLGLEQASRMLWRLNAEAPPEDRFNLADFNEIVARCGELGHVTGDSGFTKDSRVTAMLLPEGLGERRLALGVVYPTTATVNPDALLATLEHGVGHCLGEEQVLAAPFVRSMVN
ncbi:helix-turn-helix domain-containing protein [Novosphingobium sp. JCM 18896]|uniref:helix-turn-helix domain-containing protein n=1 Tax=Novosphingobium sp. JCM 18896 TaxID=2989731 RepID=UPI002223EA9B|nr:helix-turn-helix domain-containing protein [Novosphingobium sp. JCM 18896]MCW1428372.1 helix-turn-helix domain-containing protein [Novosphingobium sp. JCM 18896]